VAGSAIDPYSTRGATENQSGVFQIFDTVSMCNAISSAKEEADFVIAYVHWGHESTTVLTSGQKNMGKAFVDAGADLVVGMHSHCMQGLEYYKGKLIVYSLGNFTFSRYTLTAGMLKTNISDEGEFTNTFYPLMHKDNFTYINSGENGEAQFAELKSLLLNSDISDDYIVTEGVKKENEDE
jgi:poly-gamma-glutamate synthesis protein (capsule biosynthesis protein)